MTRMRERDPNPVMVCHVIYRRVADCIQVFNVSYIAVKEGNLWDAELVAWADRREARLKLRTRNEHVLAPGERKPGEIAVRPSDDALRGGRVLGRQERVSNPVEDTTASAAQRAGVARPGGPLGDAFSTSASAAGSGGMFP